MVLPRLKWFEDSNDTGKDNHAWYRFDVRHSSGPALHWRDRSKTIPSRRAKLCEQCLKPYEPQRTSSRFCSGTCRLRAHRKKLLSVTPSVTPAPIPNTPIEPSDCSEVLRYVRHADVPRFTAEGWERLPALDGTHHGE